MKKITILLVVFLAGCAGTEIRRYENATEYHVKDGFLQPVQAPLPENQAGIAIQRSNASQSNIPKAPEPKTVTTPSEFVPEKRSSKRIQEQVKRIQKILEKKP